LARDSLSSAEDSETAEKGLSDMLTGPSLLNRSRLHCERLNCDPTDRPYGQEIFRECHTKTNSRLVDFRESVEVRDVD
jgi:hypothetical protein